MATLIPSSVLCTSSFRSVSDPRFKGVDLVRAESSAFRRHDAAVGRCPGNECEQKAVGWFAGDDGRPTVAAAENSCGTVEPKAVFLLVGAVTRNAVLGEDRLNVAGEVRGLGRRRIGECDGQHSADETSNHPTASHHI